MRARAFSFLLFFIRLQLAGRDMQVARARGCEILRMASGHATPRPIFGKHTVRRGCDRRVADLAGCWPVDRWPAFSAHNYVNNIYRCLTSDV